jgi:hypothetical protein
VREDPVRFWRSTFITGGIEALKKSIAPALPQFAWIERVGAEV